MNTQKLTGKVAVVTGSSKGIGAAIAKHLAAEGAAVVVNYASSKAAADRVVAEIAGNDGKAVAVQADVAKKADIDRLFAETKNAFGRLDILVNNAGLYEFSPLAGVTEAHFHKHFDLNVLGLLLTSQAALALFDSAGGSIINISSVASTLGLPDSAVYSGTKGAVDAITRVLANELGPRGIRVNALNPGMVETEGMRSAGIAESDMRKQVEAQLPSAALGSPGTSPALRFSSRLPTRPGLREKPSSSPEASAEFRKRGEVMNFNALKMLAGDRAKYLGLIFAIAFCTFVLENQTSIFAGILKRTGNQILFVTGHTLVSAGGSKAK